ncbi:MAG: hypothetical protein IPL98_11280 [Saprospiraceae bacterium]|nr:hypothetical protein [Saprospiraceae bacterium]
MKTRIILFIMACSSLMTCKKANDLDPNDDKMVDTNKIVFGLNSDLQITNYDTLVMGTYNTLAGFDLDVDSNNVSDFRLTSELWGSHYLGLHPRSTIHSLNSNSLLSGILKNDTIYLNKNTVLKNGTDSTFQIYNYTTYTCKKIDSNDPISQINVEQFKVVSKNKDEMLNKSDLFRSHTFTLIDDWIRYGPKTTTSNDTTVYDFTLTDYSCNNFPQDQIVYIGFKIIDTKSEKLGWIKIKIIEEYKILIMESAIQK